MDNSATLNIKMWNCETIMNQKATKLKKQKQKQELATADRKNTTKPNMN